MKYIETALRGNTPEAFTRGSAFIRHEARRYGVSGPQKEATGLLVPLYLSFATGAKPARLRRKL
jgi:hypothetical protein